jgi:uncharacterized protein YceH (UPF0502 family)
MEPLDPVGLRVLGSLIEKELATPDNYPLTLIRWTHLLAGPPDDEAPGDTEVPAPARSTAAGDRGEALEQEVATLREEVAELRAQLDAFRRQFE